MAGESRRGRGGGFWAAVLLLGLGALCPVATSAATSTPAPPRLAFLKPTDIDPAQLLPPPPAEGTDLALAELAEVRRLDLGAGGDWAKAKYDADHEDATMFQGAVAPAFDLSQLPATARLLDEVRNEAAIFASKAKNLFKRNRPWVLDPALRTCERDSPQSSYPSGHATMAFAMAPVLAKVMPDLAPQLMTRAKEYAEERIVCGDHYRSDVVAGEVLGTTVAVLLLRDPRFEADVDAARAELSAAHLAGAAN